MPISVILAALAASAGASASPMTLTRGAVAYPALPFVRYGHTPRRAVGAYPVNPALERGIYQNGTWQKLTAKAPFGATGAGTALQLTDGSVIVQDNDTKWYRLTPDQTGSYVNGTWSSAIKMPNGYGPVYYASAVLADGRLIVEGGEYNLNSSSPVETNLGAIYDPIANSWSPVSPPQGWSSIGDAQSAVLDDGTFMLGNCCGSTQALLNLSNLTWSSTGSGKADPNSEEGWALLADGTLLTADVSDAPNSERYNPSSGSWSSAGTVPVNLVAAGEIGPQILRPDGSVFVAGATGHTAIYATGSGKWSAGPNFPVVGGAQLDIADGPGSLLPNGRILLAASPGVYHKPAYFFEFTGTKLVSVPAPPNAPNDSSFYFRLLVLPTGQVLSTDGSNDVEVYTPLGRVPRALKPKIASVPSSLTHGSTYSISGTHFNGWSQDNMYGDDVQMATNYPLVRITNVATGHVFYARTHDHSSMAVASSATVTTNFDVPANIETGASTLVVVANGIASKPVNVSVQ